MTREQYNALVALHRTLLYASHTGLLQRLALDSSYDTINAFRNLVDEAIEWRRPQKQTQDASP